jgi:hypothetical protein
LPDQKLIAESRKIVIMIRISRMGKIRSQTHDIGHVPEAGPFLR